MYICTHVHVINRFKYIRGLYPLHVPATPPETLRVRSRSAFGAEAVAVAGRRSASFAARMKMRCSASEELRPGGILLVGSAPRVGKGERPHCRKSPKLRVLFVGFCPGSKWLASVFHLRRRIKKPSQTCVPTKKKTRLLG